MYTWESNIKMTKHDILILKVVFKLSLNTKQQQQQHKFHFA